MEGKIKMEIIKFRPDDISGIAQKVIKRLKNNEIGVISSDTSYGLVTLVRNRNINRLLKIKGRLKRKPISVFVPDLDFLDQLVLINQSQRQFIQDHLDKPHTFILELESELKEQYQIIAPQGKVGIRIVAVPFLQVILKALNEPLTATSANFSNQPNCYSLKEFINQFKNQTNQPDFFVDAGKLAFRKPSTVIDLTVFPYQTIRK